MSRTRIPYSPKVHMHKQQNTYYERNGKRVRHNQTACRGNHDDATLLKTDDPLKVTCKRCLKVMRFSGIHAADRIGMPPPDKQECPPAFSFLSHIVEEGVTVPMILHCPQCSARHIDVGAFAEVAHHTHACQSCGFVWRPAKVNTHGVQFLPGYKNEPHS